MENRRRFTRLLVGYRGNSRFSRESLVISIEPSDSLFRFENCSAFCNQFLCGFRARFSDVECVRILFGESFSRLLSNSLVSMVYCKVDCKNYCIVIVLYWRSFWGMFRSYGGEAGVAVIRSISWIKGVIERHCSRVSDAIKGNDHVIG